MGAGSYQGRAPHRASHRAYVYIYWSKSTFFVRCVDDEALFLSKWADKKETFCQDETDLIKQTGGPDFVRNLGTGPIWTWLSVPGTQDPEPGTRDSGPGTRDPGPGTRDSGPGTWDPAPGTRARGHGPGDPAWGPRARGPGSRDGRYRGWARQQAAKQCAPNLKLIP